LKDGHKHITFHYYSTSINKNKSPKTNERLISRKPCLLCLYYCWILQPRQLVSVQ